MSGISWFSQLSGVNIPMARADEGAVTAAVSFMLQLAAALSLTYIIIGAVRLSVSVGDTQKIATGRRTVIFSVVGLVIAVSGLLITSFVQAQAARAATETGNPFFGPNGIITILIEQLNFAIGVASVIAIIVGAIRYITSAGVPASAQQGRNTVIYALVGIVVALAGQLLVTLVLSRI
jgi:hypothetical protein